MFFDLATTLLILGVLYGTCAIIAAVLLLTGVIDSPVAGYFRKKKAENRDEPEVTRP